MLCHFYIINSKNFTRWRLTVSLCGRRTISYICTCRLTTPQIHSDRSGWWNRGMFSYIYHHWCITFFRCKIGWLPHVVPLHRFHSVDLGRLGGLTNWCGRHNRLVYLICCNRMSRDESIFLFTSSGCLDVRIDILNTANSSPEFHTFILCRVLSLLSLAPFVPYLEHHIEIFIQNSYLILIRCKHRTCWASLKPTARWTLGFIHSGNITFEVDFHSLMNPLIF